MALKKYKATSPGRRSSSVNTLEELSSKAPERSLVGKVRRRGGRNSAGRITVRHRGGGNRRKYRTIDFKRE